MAEVARGKLLVGMGDYGSIQRQARSLSVGASRRSGARHPLALAFVRPVLATASSLHIWASLAQQSRYAAAELGSISVSIAPMCLPSPKYSGVP